MSTRHSWTIRTENNADIPRVHAINAAAFDTPAEAELVDQLRTDSAWIDGLSLVATDDTDTPIAHILVTRNHIGDTEAVCLAPMAVLPEYQRSGAGGALIRAVLREAATRGERFVTVLGHPEYYPRFGFDRASKYGIAMGVEVPDEALMVMSLDGSEPPRGIIRYAAPFGV
ncbi:GNAT family N-acetyltransferase [Nocardia sp. NPDC056100]|uniref:GNAT family N-acetyltransferase n=1 Tax=Nocardia sp. NPDC056100 TaxID=3345712 RepID=UPI0035D9BF9C